MRVSVDRIDVCGYDLAFLLATATVSQGKAGSFMDRPKLEHFRKLLETRRQSLRASVVRTEEDGRAAQDADSAQDIADRATGSYQKEFLFARSNNDRQFLQMVERALSNIADGTYGECAVCGEEINLRRLEAVPWARHCIACQEKLERGELNDNEELEEEEELEQEAD
ncbi:MAG: TraR/DksA family transcriptional regulator [Acidobacteriota bacterium]|nr:TraR/DksA family transcriptional regulator [Acidobacteriota bacterium]